MEGSVVAGRQAIGGGSELLFPVRTQLGRFKQGSCCWGLRRGVLFSSGAGRISFDLAAAARNRRRVAVIRSEITGEAVKKTAANKESPKRSVVDRPQLFVGLPLDAVSDRNIPNHSKAISAGLKALKLLGVDGVELPVWWGVAEKEAMGKYDWSGYIALAEMVRDAGLQLRVSLCFHACRGPAVPLPQWVSSIGEAEPDIFFTDRDGKRRRDCLSLAVDDLPVLNGKTPMQVFRDFFQSFRAAFSDFIGSTITDILVGLGPDGELKYPSLPPATKNSQVTGIGEFQCYDKNMLSQLMHHAESNGNRLWGLSGPHDAPRRDDRSPFSTNFFKESGGSWETSYGEFFLSWYSDRLLSHGDRLLSIASATFGDRPVTVYGKVPLVHSWYKTRSHPAESTAGFYNTVGRDGYDGVAEMFARNSCGMILPCMDLSDEHLPLQDSSHSSPESLLTQITRACERHGLPVSGENSSVHAVPDSFGRIRETLLGKKWSSSSSSQERPVVDKFTYQRMGAYFFSPEHFPLFTQFVRSLDWSQLHPDDFPGNGRETVSLTADSVSENSRHMQAV